VNLFATAIPGFGPVLAMEITATTGLRLHGERGFDGRNDIVPFSGKPGMRGTGLRTSEDVFAEIARHAGPAGTQELATILLDPAAIERALSAWAEELHPLQSRMTYRVIVRVLSEQRFQRTTLREAMVHAIGKQRPRWRAADPAELEFWAIEDKPGQFRLGLRLTTAAMRHRDGRVVERAGALRPSAAAAMVFLAGRGPGRLLDPCCGGGTILAEAQAARWQPFGLDRDPSAIAASRANLGTPVPLVHGDVRALPFGDGTFRSAVSNLPFGRAYSVQGDPQRWLTAALSELERVTVPGAPIVLLVPDSRHMRGALAAHETLRLARKLDVSLLGQTTAVWHLVHER
jgi:SAM-dependent methyltransferase